MTKSRKAKMCNGKIRHKYIHDAEKHLSTIIRKFGPSTLHVYQCFYCGYYHIGHKSNNVGLPPIDTITTMCYSDTTIE